MHGNELQEIHGLQYGLSQIFHETMSELRNRSVVMK